jgi:YHS domain-containing protein
MKSKIHEHQKNSFKLVSKRKIIYLLISFISLTTFAQNETKRITHFNLERRLGIQGYDPVAYFKQGKAVKGKKELTATYEGVIYNFSMPVNREYFLKNPSGYEPQFGGWCAYAMGDSGEKVEINPQTFKIVDGKLYLFYNAFFNNTLKSWNKDETNLKLKAENNWKKIIK